MRLWRAAVGIGGVAVVVYAVLPADAVTLRNVWYVAVEVAAIAAILTGVRRYRPELSRGWLLIAAGFSVFLVGDALWTIYEIEGRDPFPSPADAFYLAGYPLLAAGLVVAIARRAQQGRDRRALIDAALVTVTVALVSWVYIIQPALGDDDLSAFETVVTIAYPIGDLLLLAVAGRFVMGTRWNVPSLRLLVAGLALMLGGDLAYSLDLLGRFASNLQVADTLLMGSVVLIGLAGLHPSLTELTTMTRPERPADTVVRVALLVGLALVPPALLLVDSLSDEPLHIPATFAAMVIVIALVVTRLTQMTSAARRSADREAALSRYAAALLRSRGRDELLAVAERAATELARGAEAHVVNRDAGPPWSAFAAPVEVRGEVVAELDADREAAASRSVRDSLRTVAAQLSLALEREELLMAERETAKSLGAQNERLLELDRMKDQFVSSVSHELRTPLTSMVGYLEIILDGEAGQLNAEQIHFLEIVNRNCLRLVRLIEDILFVSRLDAGRFSLERRPVDLGRLAAEAVQSAGPAAQARRIELQLTVDDGLRPLDADATRLTQMLDNLISNAIKFTPEDGTVSVRLSHNDGSERLQVADTGVGIPEDELGRLFDRFFRASTSSSAQGTGLGLPIVKAIVEAHGGAIAVESRLGAGTTFTVDLPLEQGAQAKEGAGDGARIRA